MTSDRNEQTADRARRPAPEQVWTEGYLCHGAFVRGWGEGVVDLLSPQPGERILDLGCGDGALARVMMDRGAEVVGVDTAPELIARAQSRGVEVRVVDAQALAFDREFDAVFSNAALHWMTDADAVLRGLQRALRPGGRFVGEMGGHGNVAAIRIAIRAVLDRRGLPTHAPWYFPDPDEYRSKLEAHGFEVDALAHFPRPTLAPVGMEGWLDTFAGSMLNRVPETDRRTAVGEVLEFLRPALCDPAGRWTVDYVRLRFAAHLRSKSGPG